MSIKIATPIICLLSALSAVTAQSGYYQGIEHARVKAKWPDLSWKEFTGNSDFDAAIYARYSTTHDVTASLIFPMEGESLTTGCNAADIPKNDGKIVLLARGECPFRTKSENVALSGAAAMILRNKVGETNPLYMAGGYFLSSMSRASSIVSIAVPFAVGQDLIQSGNTSGPVFTITNQGIYGDSVNSSTFKSQIIFYSAGVAVAAMVLILATRICRRRVAYVPRNNTYEMGWPTEAKSAELLGLLERYEYGKGTTTTAMGDDDASKVVVSRRVVLEESQGAAEVSRSVSLNHLVEVDIDAVESGETPTCCICICDFETNQSITRLPCKHEYHEECISQWLKLNVECPLCKADVYDMVFNPNNNNEPEETTTTTTTTTPTTTAANDDDCETDPFLLQTLAAAQPPPSTTVVQTSVDAADVKPLCGIGAALDANTNTNTNTNTNANANTNTNANANTNANVTTTTCAVIATTPPNSTVVEMMTIPRVASF